VHVPHYTVIRGLSGSTTLSTLPHKWHDFEDKFNKHRFSLQLVSETVLILQRTQRDIVVSVLTYLLTPCSRVLLEKLTGSAASQEIPPHFLEPEGSSPYSQVPATCPYPKPTPSSPHNPLPLPEDPS